MICTFPIFRPLDDDSGITSKFMGGLWVSVQPTTHAAKPSAVFPGVQQYYLQQQVNTSRPPITYPTTSSGEFHFVNPVMSPATLQPSNSSSENKKGNKADTYSVVQEKENENWRETRMAQGHGT